MGLGSVVSGLVGNKGAKKAARAARKAQEKAMQEYDNAYGDVINRYNYYLPQAQQGWNNYANTINGDLTGFNASPFGKFYDDYTMNNTINRLQGTAAARGNMLSGNTLKELQTNIQSILSSDYLNRLGQYLGYNQNLGQTALGITDALNQYRWNQAQARAGAQQQIGNINSAYQMQKYNNLGNIWGGIADLGTNLLAGGMSGGLSGALSSAATGGLSLLSNNGSGDNATFHPLSNGLYQAWSLK